MCLWYRGPWLLVPGQWALARWCSNSGPGFMKQNWRCFVIRRRYKVALPLSSDFNLTVLSDARKRIEAFLD